MIERAELRKLNGQIIERIKSNVKVQEGDAPAENPNDLIELFEEKMQRLQWLVESINDTNSKAIFEGETTVSEAIARRDCLGGKIRAYRLIYESATIKQDRYNQSEIKFVRCIDAKSLQATIDKLSKEYRELDTKLQGINWTVELIEHP